MTCNANLSVRTVKAQADFVGIASRYVSLRRVGHQFVGLCPFHTERNPSFYVEPEQKIWKCFGCGRGGDVFTFVMLAEGCNFQLALRIVAGFVFGVAARSEGRRPERLEGRVGGEAPYAREAGDIHSQKTRDSIVAALNATEARNEAIARTNAEAAAEFVTACEPERGEAASLLVINRITGAAVKR